MQDVDNAIDPPSDSDMRFSADEAILRELREGDPSAFETLVRFYGPRMLATTRRLLPREQDAQDALQDAFLSAFKKIDQFEARSRLGTWLHRIAVNAALMKLRQQKSRRERPIDDLLPQYDDDGRLASPANWAAVYDRAVEDRDLRRLVRKSIDELPAPYRDVLLLRDIEELPTDETAEILEISNGAVRARLHRARLALKTLLDPHVVEAQS